MVASLRKAWLTNSRLPRGGEFHGGDANSNRRPATAAIAPAAVCMHESCIAARMAVGQRRIVVATARRSVERGVLGGCGAAGGPIPRVQCETSGSEDKRETESVGALCNAGAPNGTGVWIREAHKAEGGYILSKSNNGRYRIFLLDSLEYTEEMVENALTKAVPVITSEDARLCFYDALYMGESLVTIADEEHAKKYATAMVLLGLYVKITKEDETTF